MHSSISFLLFPTLIVLLFTSAKGATAPKPPLNRVTTLDAVPSIPSNLPSRIYPRVQLNTTQGLSKDTLISILFTQELNWPFVISSPSSSSQIFEYLPTIIVAALNIPTVQPKTLALQVFIPPSYQTPSDAMQLGTVWLGYIPTDQVGVLAGGIKNPQSLFYTGVPDNNARALASLVNSTFSLTSMAEINPTTGNSITRA